MVTVVGLEVCAAPKSRSGHCSWYTDCSAKFEAWAWAPIGELWSLPIGIQRQLPGARQRFLPRLRGVLQQEDAFCLFGF